MLIQIECSIVLMRKGFPTNLVQFLETVSNHFLERRIRLNHGSVGRRNRHADIGLIEYHPKQGTVEAGRTEFGRASSATRLPV